MTQDMLETLDAKALEILKDNDRGGYTVPTAGLYPYQWNWDSAFVALGFATFDMSRAIAELETLLEAQWSNGMIPHIVFRADDPDYFPGPSVWKAGGPIPSSGISQPPVLAYVVWTLWNQCEEGSHRDRLRAMFPALLAYHRWFRVDRDPDNLGLVIATHPWETGRDNCPEWDRPLAAVDTSGVGEYTRRDLEHSDASMRPTKQEYDAYLALVDYAHSVGWCPRTIASEGPFRVADVGMSMILLRADRALQAFALALGETTAATQIQGWIDRAEDAVQSLWNEDVQSFCSFDLNTQTSSSLVTSASFLAFFASAADAQQSEALQGHWSRISANVRYMTPSTDPAAASFDAIRYWRGPVWTVVNYMIETGLREQGHIEEAHRCGKDTAALIAHSGFNEAFSPTTGARSGGKSFSWTAAMWLAWARDFAGRG